MRSSGPPLHPWARLSVLRGTSPRLVAFHAGTPRALCVGSGAQAELRVPESCAAPEQLEVLWDGAALWLQDRLRLGSTLLNGRPLGEWTLVRGQVLVGFGAVRLWLASASPHPAPAAPDFDCFEAREPLRSATFTRSARRLPTLRFVLPFDLSELSEAAGS